MKGTLEAEKLSASNAISELRDQIRALRGHLPGADLSSSWFDHRHHMSLMGGERYDEVRGLPER